MFSGKLGLSAVFVALALNAQFNVVVSGPTCDTESLTKGGSNGSCPPHAVLAVCTNGAQEEKQICECLPGYFATKDTNDGLLSCQFDDCPRHLAFSGGKNCPRFCTHDGTLRRIPAMEGVDDVSQCLELDFSSPALGEIELVAPRTFQGLTNLVVLRLNDNKISELENDQFYGLSQLRYLTLSRNRLRYLTLPMLRHMPELRGLDLSYNKIEEIDEGTFSNSPKLAGLNLAHNNIYDLNSHTFLGLAVKSKLFLGYNTLGDPSNLEGLRELPQFCLVSLEQQWAPPYLFKDMKNMLENREIYLKYTVNPWDESEYIPSVTYINHDSN